MAGNFSCHWSKEYTISSVDMVFIILDNVDVRNKN